MKKTLLILLMVALAGLVTACGESEADGGGHAKVTIPSGTFEVSKVKLTYETGDDGYFRIEGDDAAHADQDCLPGLGGGMALYGSLPADVTSLADLSGREVPFEFSGDGDDFNLCFVGSNGLLGVERGTVRFARVEGKTIAFSFAGSFVIYDGEGGESPLAVSASGSGVAHVD